MNITFDEVPQIINHLKERIATLTAEKDEACLRYASGEVEIKTLTAERDALQEEISRLTDLVAVGREMYRILDRHDLGESLRVTPLLEKWRSLEGR